MGITHGWTMPLVNLVQVLPLVPLGPTAGVRDVGPTWTGQLQITSRGLTADAGVVHNLVIRTRPQRQKEKLPPQNLLRGDVEGGGKVLLVPALIGWARYNYIKLATCI